LKSFDEFLEKRFPESRRKAYYLMAIHEHLTRIPKRQLREVGWTKARELVKVARREGNKFDCAPWVHNALATSGMSGAGVFFFAVAGFAMGEVKTGLMIFGLGGVTFTGSGFGSTLATSCLTIFGFGCGGGGCGFHASITGASIGVVQYRWTISSLCGTNIGTTTMADTNRNSSANPAPNNSQRGW
jgi:hypothetical protein